MAPNTEAPVGESNSGITSVEQMKWLHMLITYIHIFQRPFIELLIFTQMLQI
jgi:hypothetical protein